VAAQAGRGERVVVLTPAPLAQLRRLVEASLQTTAASPSIEEVPGVPTVDPTSHEESARAPKHAVA
ncbi:MAG: hypothetical protein AAGF44_06170, partial [Pseudomonadota bacterium]